MVKDLEEVAWWGGSGVGRDHRPTLLGRPASLKEIPDLINHFLEPMRSPQLETWTPPSLGATAR